MDAIAARPREGIGLPGTQHFRRFAAGHEFALEVRKSGLQVIESPHSAGGDTLWRVCARLFDVHFMDPVRPFFGAAFGSKPAELSL